QNVRGEGGGNVMVRDLLPGLEAFQACLKIRKEELLPVLDVVAKLFSVPEIFRNPALRIAVDDVDGPHADLRGPSQKLADIEGAETASSEDHEVHVFSNFNADVVAFDLTDVGFDRGGGIDGALTGLHVELPAVPGAGDQGSFHVPFPQRPSAVRTDVVDGAV